MLPPKLPACRPAARTAPAGCRGGSATKIARSPEGRVIFKAGGKVLDKAAASRKSVKSRG